MLAARASDSPFPATGFPGIGDPIRRIGTLCAIDTSIVKKSTCASAVTFLCKVIGTLSTILFDDSTQDGEVV
jgi:hypothetical protein